MESKKNLSVVIIGAGPAGLSAAYELAAHNVKSIVLEKDYKYVGGLARTMNYKGFRFDIGGHRFFSKNKEIEDLWKKILGKDFLVKKRLSRIYYRGKFYYYPLKLFNVLANLGLLSLVSVSLSYVWVKTFPIKTESSFEEWVSNRFGRKLYAIFFKTYTEKVWGTDPSKISADWAAARIQNFTLRAIITNLFFRRNGGVIKTLINQFRYPKYGPGMLWERIKKIVEKRGSGVILGSEVVSIECVGNKVNNLKTMTNGKIMRVYGTHFLSSMPLCDLIRKLKPTPPALVLKAAENLKFRDFLVVMLVINKSKLFGDQWIYIHDPNVQVARIQNFKNWSKFMIPDAKTTSLGFEYFCSKTDKLWGLDDRDLIRQAASELEFLGLAGSKDVVDGKVVRVENAYPVYDKGYQKRVDIIRNYLRRFDNLQIIGRGGMHKYNNQDHAMMTGLLAARNVMGGRFNLWQVDADAMYLEDGAKPNNAKGRLIPAELSQQIDFRFGQLQD